MTEDDNRDDNQPETSNPSPPGYEDGASLEPYRLSNMASDPEWQWSYFQKKERKARTTLLMPLPEDHLAKFHKMADAKEMWEAIKSRFGGNDESKKMQKYLLKQQFEGTTTSSSSNTHNVAFVFADNTSSTNDVSTAYSVSSPSISKSQKEGSSLYTDEVIHSFFANQSSAPQLDYDDLEQINDDDMEEIDLKWHTKVECFNCHKIGHFARDCRAKRNQDSRRKDVGYNGNKARDNGRRSAYQDDSKALVTIDGEDIDWSGHVEEDAQNYAMMAYSSSNSSSDNDVKSCSKTCEESYARLKKLYDEQRDKLGDASVKITAYTLALKKVEAQLLCHQQNQLAYKQKIRFMNLDLDDKIDVLAYYKKLLAEALKEKEDLKTKFENWQNSFKNLSSLLNSQMSINVKFGLGYGYYRYGSILSYENEVLQSVYMNKESDLENTSINDRYADGMHVVPPLMTVDESDSKPSEYATCESESSVETTTYMPAPVNAPKVVCEPKVWTDAPIIEEENVKETGTPNHSPKVEKQDRNGLTRKGLGYDFTRKACFVCGSFSHLIRDCDFYEKRMVKQATLTRKKNKVTGQKVNRPVWKNVKRVNHQHKFVPSVLLTKTGKFPVNAARQNCSSQAASTSTSSKVNTARPFMNETRPKRYFYKSHSPNKRPFHNKTAQRTAFSYHKVNIVNTSLSAVKENVDTAVKASAGANTPRCDEDSIKLKELMLLCSKLSNKVLALEQSKTAQDLVIKKLQKKVKRIERKIKARTPRMTLFKIGNFRRIPNIGETTTGSRLMLLGKVDIAVKVCLEKKDFKWKREADKAFEEMKRYIGLLPTLLAPKAGENLIVYLVASKECISAVLMAKRGKDQRPIYFVSRVLQGAKLNNPCMKKLVLALIHAARRLKRQTRIADFRTFDKETVSGKLAKKSIHEKQVTEAIMEEENSWMTPIIEFLVSVIPPADKKLARKVRVKALNYWMIDGILYKRSFLTHSLRCVGPMQAKKVIREIHGGACELHAGP
nr:ribonuclease H-like domain, Gag-pre-integrase domain protein [Tanacetum cinerariifolium]